MRNLPNARNGVDVLSLSPPPSHAHPTHKPTPELRLTMGMATPASLPNLSYFDLYALFLQSPGDQFRPYRPKCCRRSERLYTDRPYPVVETVMGPGPKSTDSVPLLSAYR